MSYSLVQGQQFMALDLRRNQAYLAALERVITPESIVLDLGAGLGTLGLLAAQLGAKRVYLVEPEDIINVAKEIARSNGYDNITCLQGKIEEVTLPEPVDVIISVFTGNFLLQEDLLPSLFYARDKYLKPDGVTIPQGAIMEAVPVSIPDFYQKNIACWSQKHLGIDPHAGIATTSMRIYFAQKELGNVQHLSQSVELLKMDFYSCNDINCDLEITHTITKSSTCHGWIGWFSMQLGEKWLSTAPHEPPLHWSAAFLPLDPPVKFQTQEEVKFKLQRPPYGDWTWQIETDETSQKHSTFFAMPLNLKKIKRLSPQYQPKLNQKGLAAQYVLARADGNTSVAELSKKLIAEYPKLFAEPKKALNFVRNLVIGFS